MHKLHPSPSLSLYLFPPSPSLDLTLFPLSFTLSFFLSLSLSPPPSLSLSLSLSQESKLFQQHSKQLADKLLEIAAQCNTREDIRRLFPTLLDPPTHLLPPTLTRGGAQVLEAAFSHTLSQVSSLAGLTADHMKLWSEFISCGLDHISTLLPQDDSK